MKWEWIGAISGVLYVVLAARQSVFCWPVSLINLSVYFYVFQSAGLFADAYLQGFYLVLTLYGWWEWTRRREATFSHLKVTRLSVKGWAGVLVAVGVCTALIATILSYYTKSSVPWLDAHTTSVSLVAQGLTTRKKIENWWLWVWANTFYCGLYVYKGLYLTCGLYAVFLVLAVWGYFQWTNGETELSRKRL